ncbi:MAG: YgiW/YdeI family stress tolerance OB fold protein [Vibrio sp.]
MGKYITLLGLMLASSMSYANTQGGFQGPSAQEVQVQSSELGGFKGPSRVQLTQVSQLKSLKEDTPVLLKGHILESLGNEEYTFQDKSGSVIIEVDHDDWNGVTVLPETEVLLEGEVEMERGELQVEIDRIQLTETSKLD